MTHLLMPLAITAAFLLSSMPVASQPTASADAIKLDLSLDDTPTTGGFARVYKVEQESQFVPGNLADVYFGDIVIETDRFKVAIARPEKPTVGLVRGGTLMDITLGSRNLDYFGSLNTTANPTSTDTVAIYTKVSDLQHEKNSTTASVTIEGYLGEDQAPPPSASEKISVTTRFAVAKGSNVLRVDTIFTNSTTRTVWLRPADVIDWGEATVFTGGNGYAPTSSTTTFIAGTIDDFSLGYHTDGPKPMQGIHDGRDSLILATGPVASLHSQSLIQRAPTNPGSDVDRLPPEFSSIGASLRPGPGLVMFPGTETRYVMEAFGTPRKEPIYVPRAAIQYKDGQPTVTAVTDSLPSLFTRPSEHSDSYVELTAGSSYTFTRFLTVSNSNWATAAEIAYTEKEQRLGIIAGAVLEEGTKKRIADAILRISGGPDWNGDEPPPPVLQVKSRTDGTFVAPVPTGKYYVEVSAMGRKLVSATPAFDVKEADKPSIAALTLSRESHLRIAISEAETPTSSPLPVKLTLIPKPPNTGINYGLSEDITSGIRNTRYLPHGAAIFPVTPGRYRLIVSRGIEYDILQRDIEILPGQDLTVTGSLPHVMKGLLPPMISMDVGVVTSYSGSGYGNAESRVIQAACEGVQIIISGDYNHVTDLQQIIEEKKLTRWVRAFPGRRMLLHKGVLSADVFAYPLTAETSASLDKAFELVRDLPPDIAMADLRQQFPNLILEVSRPMHPEAGYINAFPYNKTSHNFPADKVPPPDFNALQLLEGKRLGQYPEIYPPYIALQKSRLSSNPLHKGPPLSPVGSSLSRLSYGQEMGYPRTYLYLDEPKSLADITEDDITSAILEQHFMVTNGPILLFDAWNYKTKKFDIGPGQVVDLKTTEICRIRARVLAAPWITLSGVATKENGLYGTTVMINKASEEVERYPGTNAGLGSNIYAREIHSDTILEATAFSNRRSLAPIVPDALEDFGGPVYPFAWSAPIFVDRNGDGKILINEKEH